MKNRKLIFVVSIMMAIAFVSLAFGESVVSER